jgi:PAS domain S-box-containing protein
MPLDLEAYRAAFDAVPAPCLLLDDNLVILAANAAYVQMVGRSSADLVSKHVFDAFPANPDDPSGSESVEHSMRQALATGRPDRLRLLKYDVELAPGSGQYEERWWSAVNVPVLDARGEAHKVLDAVEDVTDLVRERQRGERHRNEAETQRVRAEALEADLYTLSRELAITAASEALSARRLAGLAEAALELASAETQSALAEIVIGRGLVALGASGGAVGVRDDQTGTLHLSHTDSLGPDAQRTYAELPLDGPFPASVAARTGRSVLVPDREAGLAFAPEMAEAYATVGKAAWASLPLQVGDRVLGSLTASWDEPQAFPQDEVDLLKVFAAQCAQALDRMLVRDAERDATSATRRLSAALQRSLLTEPPRVDRVQIAVRYLPAAAEAQIGGDWYDAFLVAGKVSLVIGDVAGHDQDAAALMGQVRNVLRGVAHTQRASPAVVLTALDRAMADLTVGALATAVLAQLEQSQSDAALGLHVLRWSNAGHPPPLLLGPSGATELLSRPPDLLLGHDPDTARTDHTRVLQPGSTVLFYSDGLVERRGASIDEGLAWLRDVVARCTGLGLEQLCDAVLIELADGLEDDVALMAVRLEIP